jgi:hypothetical protein
MSAPDEVTRARSEELILLGTISGKLDGVTTHLGRQDAKMDALDGRLRSVEQKAAILGGVSGGVMAVGTSLIIEGLKAWYATRIGGG